MTWLKDDKPLPAWHFRQLEPIQPSKWMPLPWAKRREAAEGVAILDLWITSPDVAGR